ncbi:hypothetical protein [Streptomyces blattellae]|uniref:hypothetical protein n=1 Tax=Streptomyces blattellae TaxID=2569855 RepID=UPI0012B92C40|nr:hypothetical protein [Streptomyces blattellae]
MPEDEIAQAEIAALTRRFEERAEKTDREFGIVKSDLTAVRLQVGNLDQKLDSFITEQRAANARIIELLSGLVGTDPNIG